MLSKVNKSSMNVGEERMGNWTEQLPEMNAGTEAEVHHANSQLVANYLGHPVKQRSKSCHHAAHAEGRTAEAQVAKISLCPNIEEQKPRHGRQAHSRSKVSMQTTEFVKAVLEPMYRAQLITKEQYKSIVTR
jgi:hypothetical protein